MFASSRDLNLSMGIIHFVLLFYVETTVVRLGAGNGKLRFDLRYDIFLCHGSVLIIHTPCITIGCQCEDYINSGGWGNCIKKDNGKALCYVENPSSSSCSDLKDSASDPGRKWSFEACLGDRSIFDTLNCLYKILNANRWIDLHDFHIFY